MNWLNAKNVWKEVHGNELYVYWNGELIYKRWLLTGASLIFDSYGIPWRVGLFEQQDGEYAPMPKRCMVCGKKVCDLRDHPTAGSGSLKPLMNVRIVLPQLAEVSYEQV